MSIKEMQRSIKEIAESMQAMNSYLDDHDEYTSNDLVSVQHAILSHVFLALNQQQHIIEDLYKCVYKLPENQEILRLKKLREHLGLNQRQFAEDIGYTKVTVSRWETGKQKINEKKINQYMIQKGVSLKDIE